MNLSVSRSFSIQSVECLQVLTKKWSVWDKSRLSLGCNVTRDIKFRASLRPKNEKPALLYPE